MATVNIKAFKHHKKSDGTINLKLVVYHSKATPKYAYPETAHYVVESQLTKNYKVKDPDLIIKITKELAIYREKIGELGPKQNSMTAAEIGEHLIPSKAGLSLSDKFDFIAFGKQRVQELKDEDRIPYAGTLQSVVNNFTDFMKSDIVYTSDITSDLLVKYEKYLRAPHVQKRINQFGKEVVTNKVGMEDAGIFAHMKDFRILFNAIRNKYNDPDTGVIRIPNYPFAKYKLKDPPEPEQRSLPIEFIRKIRDCEGLAPGGRAELGRDIFMLSFYMLGMNAVDIYEIVDFKGDRLGYNRSKTEGHRSDGAFISVKIIPEARLLFGKYAGELKKRYSSIQNFQKAIQIGLKQVARKIWEDSITAAIELGLYNDREEAVENTPLIEFDFYGARHTVGNEATNTLGFSVLDVGKALNHQYKETKMTNKYIRKDWSIIDSIQAAVVNLLNSLTPELLSADPQ